MKLCKTTAETRIKS